MSTTGETSTATTRAPVGARDRKLPGTGTDVDNDRVRLQPKPVYASDLLLGSPASSITSYRETCTGSRFRTRTSAPAGLTVADLWGNSVVVALSAPDAPADPV